MNPSTGRQLWRTAVGIHRNDNLTSLSGDDRDLARNVRRCLDPACLISGYRLRGDPERPRHAASRPDRLLRRQNRNDARRSGGSRCSERPQALGYPRPGRSDRGCHARKQFVLTATLQGSIFALSRASGKVVWKLQAPGGIDGWMSIAGKTIVVPVGLAVLPPSGHSACPDEVVVFGLAPAELGF